MGSVAGSGGGSGSGEKWLCQMVIHKSLDSVEEVMEGTGSLYVSRSCWSAELGLDGSVYNRGSLEEEHEGRGFVHGGENGNGGDG